MAEHFLLELTIFILSKKTYPKLKLKVEAIKIKMASKWSLAIT